MNLNEIKLRVVASLQEETWKWIVGGIFSVLLGVFVFFRDWAWRELTEWAALNPLGTLFFALGCVTIMSLGFASYWWVERNRIRSSKLELAASLEWKGRYESVPNSPNTIVFRLKEEYANNEGQHLICPVCYFGDKRSLLVAGNNSNALVCNQCRTSQSISDIPRVGASKLQELLKAAESECATLRNRLVQYEPSDLQPFEETLIKELAMQAQGVAEEDWAIKHMLPQHRLEYHIERLESRGFIYRVPGDERKVLFKLRPKGRDFAIARQFI